MSQFTINIAYASENKSLAQELATELNPIGINFKLIGAANYDKADYFFESLINSPNPTLLLVSDNFLKSEICMEKSLAAMQALIRDEKVIPIITDGIYENKNGETQTIVTEFEKVSNIMKYMNFWQERYLNLRKLKRTASIEEKETLVNQLKKVRSISSEIGEFLRNLRDTTYYSEVEFKANHYEIFFKIFGNETAHLNFIESRNTTAVSEIPIIEETTEGLHLEEIPTAALILENQNNIGQTNIQPTIEVLESSINTSLDLAENVEDPNLDLRTDSNLKIIENNTPIIPIETINTDDISLEKLAEYDPEWNIAKEEMEKENMDKIEKETSLKEIAENQERTLTETELLALELAEKLPNEQVITIENKEEEVISLEDLMEEEFLAPTVTEVASNELDTLIPEEIEMKQEELKEVIMEEDKEEEAVEISSIISDTSEETSNDENEVLKENLLEKVQEGEEEEELEGYFEEEEEEDEEEIEEELSEFEVLQSANTLAQSGKIEESITLLGNVLEEAPEFISVRYQYAAFLAQYKNDFKAASNQLAKLLEQEPNNLSAKFFLGELAEAERDYLTAKSYFEKVHEENPDFPNVAYKLGMLLIFPLKESPEEAAKYLAQAYQQNANNINALYQLGVLQNETFKDTDQAIISFTEVLEKAPEHPFVNYDLALIYYNRAAYEKALAFYEAACLVNPELKTNANDQVFTLVNTENQATPSIETLADEIDQKIESQILEATATNNISDVAPLTAQNEISLVKELDANISEEVLENTPDTNITKTVFITGASSGIGRATAHFFAKNGYKLLLAGRRYARLFTLKEDLEAAHNANIKLLPFDIQDADTVQKIIEELEEEWQDIDILINNAGLAKGLSSIHDGQIADWNTMIDTNIKGMLYMTRAIAPAMVKKKQGHIINISSLGGKEVYPNNAVYCTTKHAVDGLTKAMRLDLYKYNIRVSQVSPGYVEGTEFSIIRSGGETGKNQKMFEDFKPATAEDIASIIYFIASQPPHLTIQEITVTGTQQASANIINKSGRD